MNIIDFFITEQKRLHNWMGTSVSDLMLEEWHYMPQGNGNSIAFLVWHCVRTEDNILRFILQRRPPAGTRSTGMSVWVFPHARRAQEWRRRRRARFALPTQNYLCSMLKVCGRNLKSILQLYQMGARNSRTGCDGQASGRYDGSPSHWPGLYHPLLYAFW